MTKEELDYKNTYEIGEIVNVYIKIPGTRKEKGYYLRGEIKSEKTQGHYKVFFPDVEIAGKKGTHGWYRPNSIRPTGPKEELNENKSEK